MGTTINSYSVGLTLDANDYITKCGLSASETRKLTRDIEQARSPAERYSREQDRLSKALAKGAIDQATYNRLLDSAATKFNKVEASAGGFTNAVTKLQGGIGGLIASHPILAASAIGFTAIGGAIVGAAAVGSKFISAMREAQDQIDETAKSAHKLGMTYSEFQGLAFAADEIANVTAEGVDKAVTKLQVNLAKAAGGDKKLTEAFEKLGIDAGDAMQKGPLEAIKQIAKGFEGITSQAEKLALATALFGKGGAGFVEVLNEGRDVLEESAGFQEKWNGLTEAQVFAVEANNDAWGRVDVVVGGIVTKLSADMAVAMDMLAEQILGAAAGFQEIDDLTFRITNAAVHIAGNMKDVVDIFVGIAAMPTDILSGDLLKIKGNINSVFDFSSGDKAETSFLQRYLKNIEEAENKRLEMEAERRTKSEEDESESVDKKTEKAIEAEEKKYAAMIKTAQENNREMNQAIADAESKLIAATEKIAQANDKEFNDWMTKETARKKAHDRKVREDVAKGPGAGMEVGSSEAAKYLADQTNARIGADMMPERPTPGEEKIAAAEEKQLVEFDKLNAYQKQQVAMLAEIRTGIKENGFKRIR